MEVIKKNPEVYHAVQFLSNLTPEDDFITGEMFGDRVVYVDEDGPYVDVSICGTHRYQKLRCGDWLVTDEMGAESICGAQEFQYSYLPIT